MADLPGYGKQINDLQFKDTWDWFIAVRPLKECWEAQPTYLLSEYTFYLIALLTLVHSFIIGGRWKYLWLGCIFHGITTELVSFGLPDIDNYWHSQTSIIFLGRRLPLHIPLIYPSFMYIAAYTTAHMRLPKCVEPLAAGLTEVLMDLPYDIMAVKFVHWTWHDTDPSIYDRHYHVPWNSYYFHLTFGTAFNIALPFWRRRITGTDDKWKVSSAWKEILCALLAGLCGMPGGVIQFVLLYHPLHDTYGIHTENCVITIIGTYLLIVWAADRNSRNDEKKQSVVRFHWSVLLILLSIFIHYSLYLAMAIIGEPDREVSIGLHETLGNCRDTSDVRTPFGDILKKNKYLCAQNYDESYFSLKCGKGLSARTPTDGASWYTICGTPYDNRAEYVAMISAVCVFAAFIYYNMLFKSWGILVGGGSAKKVGEKKKRQ